MASKTGIIHETGELRKLIAENPDLPIVVLAGDDASCDCWAWTFCASVSCSVDEILDIRTPYDQGGEKVFTDRDDFLEDIEEVIFDENPDMSPEEIEAAAKREADMYDGCWRKVIAIWANN